MHALRRDLADGYIARYEHGAFRIIADGFHFTNEIRFDAKEEFLYVVETTGGHITRLRIDEQGEVREREISGPSTLGTGAWPEATWRADNGEIVATPKSGGWEAHTVTDTMTCEFMLLKDIEGDGAADFIFKDSENKFVFAKPDPANPTGMWTKHAISERGPWANHGMGVGDINGDGRVDFLNAYGWWEQPAN